MPFPESFFFAADLEGEHVCLVEGDERSLVDDVAFVVEPLFVVTCAACALVSLDDDAVLLLRDARLELMIRALMNFSG